MTDLAFVLGVACTLATQAAWRWLGRQFGEALDDFAPGRLVHGHGSTDPITPTKGEFR